MSSSGGVAAVQNNLEQLYYAIEDTIDDLKVLDKIIENVNVGTHNLNSAIEGVNRRISIETAKKNDIEATAWRFNKFLDNATYTDTSVASTIRQNQNAFYASFPRLRPAEPEPEPGFWEQLANAWNDFWGDVGDWLGNLVDNVVDWIKEHAVELIIGVVCIVIGAVLTALSGGTFLAALGNLFLSAVISGVVGGVISGVIALFTGDNFWDAFGDGFASGFMFAGILSAISGTISAISGVIKGAGAVDDVINATDDIVNGADDVINSADDVINSADDVLNNADDLINSADDVANSTDDVLNNADDLINSTDDVANVADDAIKTFEAPGGLKDRYPQAYEHLKGEVVKGKPKGYHYKMNGSNGTVEKVIAGPDKYGVYNAKVSINGVEKNALSSMFPDEWTAQQVTNAIDEAVGIASKMPVKPNLPYAHTVNLSNGMPIRVCFDKAGNFVNAFPIFTP